MKIGFVGAGKVGFSLGKYLYLHGETVTGYYNRTPQAALEAAMFTNTTQYLRLSSLVESSEVLFLTVTDDAIPAVWQELRKLPLAGKLICHTSGSLSSRVFEGIEELGAYGCSVHPLYAFNDKLHSYEKLGTAFFTIEGSSPYRKRLVELFCSFGNPVATISAEDKTKYHAAAAIVSNLSVGLTSLGEDLLTECGFTVADAHKALAPLIMNNVGNVIRYGTTDALTGPIERNDITTVGKHLAVIGDADQLVIYKSLSRQVLEIAKKKHRERDYAQMEELLK